MSVSRSGNVSLHNANNTTRFSPIIPVQRFIYDFRVLKGDYSDARRGTLERLASNNAFALAMAQSKDPQPPTDLSGLLSALSEEVRDSHQ